VDHCAQTFGLIDFQKNTPFCGTSMTVLLHSSKESPTGPFDSWASIGNTTPDLDRKSLRPTIGAELEQAFDQNATRSFDLAKTLAEDPTAGLAQAPSCAANISDLSLMLAWSLLIAGWAKGDETILVICDDPWMFRHLSDLSGVCAGRRPVLWRARVRLGIRGYAARFRAAIMFAAAALRMKVQRKQATENQSWLLVYGHPTSDIEGNDGYFGNLMKLLPNVQRLLHVDCSADRARELAHDSRTLSLHAWGSPMYAILRLPFARWKPRPTDSAHWLVRRAAALEGGTGQPAAISWQNHCQDRWLINTRPHVVSWPWENHSWERSFVRSARANKTRTIGYQHSVVGRQMLNYAANSNVDGTESLPDKVLCSGGSTRDQLQRWGMPENRLDIGGALRFLKPGTCTFDAAAPVLVVLPFNPIVATEMVSAAKGAVDSKRLFLIKQHPMAPLEFGETSTVKRTDLRLDQHQKISAVLYAASTVGLEAILQGLPTLRFRSQRSFAIDILPQGIDVDIAGEDNLSSALDNVSLPAPLERDEVLAEPDISIWTKTLGSHQHEK
jgi:hypothetical protein